MSRKVKPCQKATWVSNEWGIFVGLVWHQHSHECFEGCGSHDSEQPTLTPLRTSPIEPAKQQGVDIESVDEELLELLKTLRVKDASEQLSRETGLPKRDLYQRALVLKEQLKDG